MIQKSNYILNLCAVMLLLNGVIGCKKSNEHTTNAELLTIFELSNGTESANYQEGMWWWKQLDEAFD